jgi:hypothetical protein
MIGPINNGNNGWLFYLTEKKPVPERDDTMDLTMILPEYHVYFVPATWPGTVIPIEGMYVDFRRKP